jgi:hypothetical protein
LVKGCLGILCHENAKHAQSAELGALEAYLAAAWFKIFGVSLFGLRIGLVGLYALFLALLYAIVCRV